MMYLVYIFQISPFSISIITLKKQAKSHLVIVFHAFLKNLDLVIFPT